MKSGDYSIPRDDEYHQNLFSQITDRAFTQRTFSLRPSLVAKEPVNGLRLWKDYDGEDYDPSKFTLVEGMWDHEHCFVCWFTIKEGFTYWENTKRVKLLCDACYEALSPH
jgi:hypothetical protein